MSDYYADTSRGATLKRRWLRGAAPVDVNLGKVAEVQAARLPTGKKAARKVFLERQEVAKNLLRIHGGTRMAAPLREAFTLKGKVATARAMAHKAYPEGGLDYPREAVKGELRVYASAIGKKPSKAKLAEMDTMTEDQLLEARRFFDWDSRYLERIRDARRHLEEQGVTLEYGG